MERNEYVSMLSWILNTYKGEEMMGHPDLKEHAADLNLLLPQEVLNTLQEQYLKVNKLKYFLVRINLKTF